MHRLLLPVLGASLALSLIPARAGLESDGAHSLKVVGNNRTAALGPVSTSLNGTQFINQGLVGAGRLAASQTDAWGDTLGSVSGLFADPGAWKKTGANSYQGTFFTLPDRGYNTGAYYSDYAARLQRLDFTFTPYDGPGVVGQSQIQLSYSAAGSQRFTYSTGGGLSLTTGLDPASGTQLLFGKTVPLAASQTINGQPIAVNKLALDSEGVVLRPDGSGYLSDEYGANVYHFDAQKRITGVITPPPALQPHTPAGTLNFGSTAAPDNGRRNNQGAEGVAISPDGTRLFVLMQSAAVQDSTSSNQASRRNTRLLVYDLTQGPLPETPIAEHIVQLPVFRNDGDATKSANRTAAQSEIVALSNGQLLVLSRDGNGLGAGGTPVFKSVLLIDTAQATNLVGLYDAEGAAVSPGGVLAAGVQPVDLAEAINMLNSADLARFGLNLDQNNAHSLSEKWEGMALLPAFDALHPDDYFLFVANDNDFLTRTGHMRQADGSFLDFDAGQEVDTMFLAYRVTIEPGPDFTPIPEPATWGALAGALALGLAWWSRQRARR